MEGVRSLLSDQLQEAPQPSPLPQEPPPAIQERAKTPEPPTSHVNSDTEALKSQATPIPEEGKSFLLQGLEGTMALLAAKGVEGTKSIYPLAMENLRAFLPYNSEGVKSYLQERIESHKAGRERRESGRPCEEAGEVRQGHRSHHSPKSQLSNPRHDATLVHAIRELHEEEFGLDAVLLAEGGHVGAHCAVLAAASPFLKTLLLTTPDHPAIISVTGTPLATVQGVVTCLYTGTVPPSASLYQLIEVANLLRMDDLSLVLQQTFIAQGGSLLELARFQGTLSSAPPYHTHSESHHTHSESHHTHMDLYHDRSEKKRGSRLDQILYQKLNVNHLAPTSTPDHCPAPPLDPRGGILGELLTKADPMRSVFAAGGYSFPDLTLDPQANPALKPLNLSKDSKSDPSSSYSHYAAPSQSDLTLGALASLPCNMPGLLAPLTHNSMLPSALASLTTSSALASLGVHHSLAAAKSKSSSKNRSGNRSSSSRSSSRHSSNSRKSSHSSLPLLHSLKSNMVTQDAAKELSDHLKLNPHLASLTSNFDSLHNNLSALSSSASLQSLANLHNLSNLHNFPALFPFLAPVTSENIGKDTHLLHGNPAMDLNLLRVSSEQIRALSPGATTSEDQGALNLSAAAPQCDSPKPLGSEDRPSRSVDSAEGRGREGGDEGGEEMGSLHHTSPKEDGCQGLSMCSFQPTKIESDSLSSRLCNSTANSFLGHSLDSRTLPLLLMSSGANLTGTTQNPGDIPKTVDASVETLPMITKQEPPPLVSLDDVDPQDDNGIEVIEEIPGNRCPFQVRKTLYHAGHSHPTFPHLQMGRKRKGCGECDGCQVVEDCSQCRFCRDKAKFGGPNRLKQVCVYKRCVLAEIEPEEAKKRRKMSGKKGRGKCGGCDGCQRTLDCNECYACLHNAAAQPPARRKICEMRVCEQQQMEEVRAALSVAGEPSPYSTDSLLLAETLSISSGASSPTPDQPSTHNDKMKLMRKMLKKKFAQPYSRVRTKYYCGECPGCQTTTPCGNCLYCEDMPKFGGPGRYRQKCVKQLCVYHPRLQALKLSNRSKLTYDEQHISQATLSHLETSLPSVAAADALDLGCRDNLEELESLGDDVDDVTEGEDSNAPLHVETALEELRAIKTEPAIKLETVLSPSSMIPSLMMPSTIIPSSVIPSTIISSSIIPSPIIFSPIIPCALPPPMITLPPVSADSIPTPAPYLPSDPPTDPEPEVIPICDDSISSIPNVEDSTMSTTNSESAITMTTTTTTTTSAIPPTTTATAAITTTTTDDADPVAATTTTTTAVPTLSPTPTPSQSPPAPALTPTPPSEVIAPSSPTPCLLPIPALTPTPCLSPVPALTPTTGPPVPTHIRTSSQSPPPVHIPTPSQSPTPAHTPTPSQSPTPVHIPTSSQSPTPVHMPTPSQSPTPAHMPIPSQSPTPAHMPIPSQSPPPAQISTPSLSPPPPHISTPSLSPPPAHISTPSLSPTTAHISAPSLSPTPAHILLATASQSPPPAIAPNSKPVISETETENLEELNDIEPADDDDDEEEDYDDREDYAALMSDASDIPSPPSTPSPRPRTRGRGSFRGRGRGRGGKDDLDGVIIETRRKKAMRRGSRRRKTRFNLEPDDNSDFEELLEELDANGLPKVVGEASGQTGEATGGVPLPGDQAERLPVDLKDGQAPPVIDGRGGRGGGRGQRYMNPPAKMVSRSQNTDPDIFEFQDSQDLKREVIEIRRSGLGLRREGLESKREGVETRRVRMEGVETRRVVEARREAMEMRKEGLETRREGVETRREAQEGGVSLKRNGPYAGFPEEELSQGGRDVNENVGGISEAASA